MEQDYRDYSLYFKLIKTYLLGGFKGINRDDMLMLELEALTEHNDQFYYISDILAMRVLFTSKRSTRMLGIPPEELTPFHFMEAVHPDDIKRLSIGRCKLIGKAQELYAAGKGEMILSTNFRFRNAGGSFTNILIQNYLFYTDIPYKTVFHLKVHTNIDGFKRIKHGFHYYIGSDLSYFRYPDDEYLSKGNVFSKREFEIIKLIESGLSTEQIAEKLFLSPFTVNTHRANILEKTGKSQISDLISDLRERGLL
jgi:DNA-binding CsgD family transcriptional regulator